MSYVETFMPGSLLKPRFNDIMYSCADFKGNEQVIECDCVILCLGPASYDESSGMFFMFPWGEVGWISIGEVLPL